MRMTVLRRNARLCTVLNGSFCKKLWVLQKSTQINSLQSVMLVLLEPDWYIYCPKWTWRTLTSKQKNTTLLLCLFRENCSCSFRSSPWTASRRRQEHLWSKQAHWYPVAACRSVAEQDESDRCTWMWIRFISKGCWQCAMQMSWSSAREDFHISGPARSEKPHL